MTTPADVIRFWSDAGEDRWFRADPAFDESCRRAWRHVWEDARAGRLSTWEETPEGALALVLLLDQMPRNMFRGTPETYATDAAARGVAERAIARGFDARVPQQLKRFFHLPFMHGEDLAAQDRSLALAEAAGDPDGVKWARHHRDIVVRFGRFPHRNAILGRPSTPEEVAWMAEDGAFKG
ncbi:DUF924 family protein [uncultured Alsobacter sp.]|uniref:DUF924 family protein n=1 Tax=uncultured Alsobacter sp. TaxID=1748258 RepID=UPI0025E42B56|nr:DUF924 family protein [uncultured Alsobacter sp.]